MGRGRQKAKHTKVARELKYFSPSTDLTALEKEIGHLPPPASATFAGDEEPEYEDKWADLYGDESDDDEDSEDSDNDTEERR